MEDDFVFIGQFRSDPHLDLIGLFDGHRGTSAARYAARELSAVLDEHMKHNPKPRDALHESFLALNKLMRGDEIQTGTTAIVSLLTADGFFIANAGDSRAVLCRGTKAIRLTTDHRPDSPEEIARITKLGGDIQDVVTKDGKVISRVGGLLGVSRALGDFDLEPFVTAHPEVAEFSWGPDEPDNHFVIIACDGLWECVTDQEAVEIAKHFVDNVDAEAACKRLRDIAYARGSTDNISVCIVALTGDQDTVRETGSSSTSSTSSSSTQTPSSSSKPKKTDTDPATDGNKPAKRRRCTIL
jgi:serine/threonine protein phosphatase PrpC